jgi:hypothetical protein
MVPDLAYNLESERGRWEAKTTRTVPKRMPHAAHRGALYTSSIPVYFSNNRTVLSKRVTVLSKRVHKMKP